METALLLSPSEAERAARTGAGSGFSGILVGSEFCQNQLPSAAGLRRLAAAYPGVRLGLAASIMTDAGLARWRRLLAGLPAGLVSEAVVNDLGFLGAVPRRLRLSLSLGRLLLREFAGMEPGWARTFLRSGGFRSAEADAPELARAAARLGLAVSWHRPGRFAAVTTFCPFERHSRAVCAHGCEDRALELRNPKLPAALTLAEKAYFYPNASAAPRGASREVLTLNLLSAAKDAR